MATGTSHDRATCLLAVPFGLLCWPWLGSSGAAIGALAFLLGGLWLSPDLDILSRPTQRWGPLRCLWWPYRRLLPHRSVFSHAPLLGSAGRLLYLAAVLLPLCWLAAPLGLPSPLQLLQSLVELWQRHRPLLIAALLGLEGSAWLHLIQDGDPLPRGPRLVLQRRRR